MRKCKAITIPAPPLMNFILKILQSMVQQHTGITYMWQLTTTQLNIKIQNITPLF